MPLGQQRHKLSGLNAPDFDVIASHAEDRDICTATKAVEIIDVTVENHPSDSRAHRSFRRADQSSGRQRLQQDRIRPRCGSRLHNFQDLPALGHRVVVGVKNLYFGPKSQRAVPPAWLSPAHAGNYYR